MLLAEIKLENFLLRHLLLLFLIVLLQHSRPLRSGLSFIELIFLVELALAFARWHNNYINSYLNRQSNNLEEKLGIQELNVRLLNIDHTRRLRHHSLSGDAIALLVCLGFLFIVFANAVEEIHSGSRELEMLDTNVNSFGNDTISDLLVDNHTNSTRVHVEDSSSATVIVLVWHALVNGSVDSDVNDISDLVGCKGFGDVNGTVLFKTFTEFVTGSTLVSVTVSHLWLKIL
jgi:hypothetical protein